MLRNDLKEVLNTAPKRLICLFSMLIWISCASHVASNPIPEGLPFYFPSHMTALADDRTVALVNTNFDQRYDAGWITLLDKKSIAQSLLQRSTDAKIFQKQLHQAVKTSIRIPSLSGPMSINRAGNRGFIGHRGRGLLTAVEIAENASSATLSCGDKNNNHLPYSLQATDCDSQHVLDLVDFAEKEGKGAAFRDYQDPYWPVILQEDPLVLGVSYLGTASMTLIESNTQKILDPLLITSDLGLGYLLSFYKTPAHQNDTSQSFWIAASHGRGVLLSESNSSDGFTSLLPARKASVLRIDVSNWSIQPRGTQTQLQPLNINEIFLKKILGPLKIVDLTTSTDGSLMYVITQAPDDTSQQAPDGISILKSNTVLNAQGQSSADSNDWRILSTIPLTNMTPFAVRYITDSNGDWLVVSSFDDNQILFFAVSEDTLILKNRLHVPVGFANNDSGPYDLHHYVDGTQSILLVSHFLGHGLGIVDLSKINEGSMTYDVLDNGELL